MANEWRSLQLMIGIVEMKSEIGCWIAFWLLLWFDMVDESRGRRAIGGDALLLLLAEGQHKQGTITTKACHTAAVITQAGKALNAGDARR